MSIRLVRPLKSVLDIIEQSPTGKKFLEVWDKHHYSVQSPISLDDECVIRVHLMNLTLLERILEELESPDYDNRVSTATLEELKQKVERKND